MAKPPHGLYGLWVLQLAPLPPCKGGCPIAFCRRPTVTAALQFEIDIIYFNIISLFTIITARS